MSVSSVLVPVQITEPDKGPYQNKTAYLSAKCAEINAGKPKLIHLYELERCPLDQAITNCVCVWRGSCVYAHTRTESSE